MTPNTELSDEQIESSRPANVNAALRMLMAANIEARIPTPMAWDLALYVNRLESAASPAPLSEGAGGKGLPFDPEYAHGYLSGVLAETVGKTKDPHITALMHWLLAASTPSGSEGAGTKGPGADGVPAVSAPGEIIGWQWRRTGQQWPEKLLHSEPALTAPDTEKRAIYAGPAVAYGVQEPSRRCAGCDLPNGCPEYCWCDAAGAGKAEYASWFPIVPAGALVEDKTK